MAARRVADAARGGGWRERGSERGAAPLRWAVPGAGHSGATAADPWGVGHSGASAADPWVGRGVPVWGGIPIPDPIRRGGLKCAQDHSSPRSRRLRASRLGPRRARAPLQASRRPGLAGQAPRLLLLGRASHGEHRDRAGQSVWRADRPRHRRRRGPRHRLADPSPRVGEVWPRVFPRLALHRRRRWVAARLHAPSAARFRHLQHASRRLR